MAEFYQWSKEDADRAKKMAGPERELLRIEAFSDGVFAVAITLLILSVQVPAWSKDPLSAQLFNLWPEYVGYLVSFLTILVMWMNHHRLFTLTKRSNTWLLLTNGLLLMAVVFVPFPTEVLARNLRSTALPADRLTAVLFYTGTFVALSILFNLLRWCITANDDLIDRKTDQNRIEAITRQYLMGPVMYLAALGVAFLSPEASIAMNLLYAVFFAIPGLTFAKQEPLEEDA